MNLRLTRAPRLPDGPEAPEFLRQDIETEVARLPRPVTADPLSPAVKELLSKAILESGEAYVQSVLDEVEQKSAAWEEYRKHVHAWAEGERARIQARAEDVAMAHAEMLESRDKFLALPRTEQTAQESSDVA